MGKVTSKLQVTVPKAIADAFGIGPGSEIEWVAAGDMIRVLPTSGRRSTADVAERLRLFDAATLRLRRREAARPRAAVERAAAEKDRGWRREDLYAHARSR